MLSRWWSGGESSVPNRGRAVWSGRSASSQSSEVKELSPSPSILAYAHERHPSPRHRWITKEHTVGLFLKMHLGQNGDSGHSFGTAYAALEGRDVHIHARDLGKGRKNEGKKSRKIDERITKEQSLKRGIKCRSPLPNPPVHRKWTLLRKKSNPPQCPLAFAACVIVRLALWFSRPPINWRGRRAGEEFPGRTGKIKLNEEVQDIHAVNTIAERTVRIGTLARPCQQPNADWSRSGTVYCDPQYAYDNAHK